jgi:hypothetical protein
MDGTLLGAGGSLFRTATGEFTLAGARALELCRRRGAELSIVSGRSVHLLREDARLLGVDNFIGEAGCVVVREGGRVVRTNCDPYAARAGMRVFDEIAATGAPQLLFGSFGEALAYHAPWHLDHEYSHLMRGQIDIAAANALLEENGLSQLKVVDNGIIEDRGFGMPVDELHAYHLIPRQSGKGTAILMDQAMSGFSREETIACGDSAQDLEMAPVVGTLFLMANAFNDNPGLEVAMAGLDNVVVVDGRMVEGFLEAMQAALGRPG